MRLKVLATAALAVGGCVCLAGCQTASDPAAVLKQLGETYAHCTRHITYSAGVGVLAPGAQISGSVDCPPAPIAAAGDEAAPLDDVALTP